MLGDFITRGLVTILAYAYPAFECYKIVEKNRIEIEELRFWCQYWILVAVLTVLERFGDIFISWFPMYGEMKLAFFIYLWHPKTKGASYVYQTFLRPYVAQHETDIDRKLLELRARVWDLVIQHWQNSANYGQNAFLQIIQYLVAQSSKVRNNNTQVNSQYPPSAPPPPPPPMTINRTVSPVPKSDFIQDHLPFETQSQATIGESMADPYNSPNSTATQEFDMGDMLRSAKTRLRRSRPQQ